MITNHILFFCAVVVYPPQRARHNYAYNIGTNICVSRFYFIQFELRCFIQQVHLSEGIRTVVPTPNRTWTTDPENIVIYSAPDNVHDPEIESEFFEDSFRQLLLPGLVGNPLSTSSTGLTFTFGPVEMNLTNPDILPDLPRRDQRFIRNLIFDELLGTYTCLVENEYGFDVATTIISECGKHYSYFYKTSNKNMS